MERVQSIDINRVKKWAGLYQLQLGINVLDCTCTEITVW